MSKSGTPATSTISSALYLADFDWKIKWVASSSSLSAINSPLLRLELSLDKGPVAAGGQAGRGGVTEQPQILVTELSASELDAFLGAMQAAIDALESVSPLAAEGASG
eukprot:TRINITY_DN15273_c0_g1_i1.p3 TRINITY_DN15273_c0_g1~~TRINITY_DN15273_c0_g1_i1.p3  ORF type:complete len:108 (+),score=31.00 TRINITY_DN15273_c0_g1_i1:384-707(+)